MHVARNDALMRVLGRVALRRGLVQRVAIAWGLAVLAPEAPMAKTGKKQKLKRNQYGCVAVGGRCRGRDRRCCSGRCQGAKPTKGENDKRRCVAHHTGTIEAGSRGCLAGDDSYGPGETLCTTNAGEEFAQCWRTTGEAGYCGFGAVCIPGGCRKDADCAASCGAGAACIVIPDYCQGTDTVCFGQEGCVEP